MNNAHERVWGRANNKSKIRDAGHLFFFFLCDESAMRIYVLRDACESSQTLFFLKSFDFRYQNLR